MFWSYLWGFETRPNADTLPTLCRFWSYLWGFETRIVSPNKDRLAWVLELPMRVWNMRQGGGVGHEDRQFWSYLWGFETADDRRGSVLPYSVLELPMRVWNVVVLVLIPKQSLFWSYLWGFETASWRPVLRLITRFGVTYEGLKPSSGPPGSARSYRFGVTYEGLKPIKPAGVKMPAATFWSYLWGFETNTTCRFHRLQNPVLELPMRVWNQCRGMRHNFHSSFWSYLWGFET